MVITDLFAHRLGRWVVGARSAIKRSGDDARYGPPLETRDVCGLGRLVSAP